MSISYFKLVYIKEETCFYLF